MSYHWCYRMWFISMIHKSLDHQTCVCHNGCCKCKPLLDLKYRLSVWYTLCGKTPACIWNNNCFIVIMWLFISWINVTSCITLICLELCARLKRVCKVEILFQQRVNSLVTEYKFGKSWVFISWALRQVVYF